MSCAVLYAVFVYILNYLHVLSCAVRCICVHIEFRCMSCAVLYAVFVYILNYLHVLCCAVRCICVHIELRCMSCDVLYAVFVYILNSDACPVLCCMLYLCMY